MHGKLLWLAFYLIEAKKQTLTARRLTKYGWADIVIVDKDLNP
jgi:hypothetical protein